MLFIQPISVAAVFAGLFAPFPTLALAEDDITGVRDIPQFGLGTWLSNREKVLSFILLFLLMLFLGDEYLTNSPVLTLHVGSACREIRPRLRI